MRLKDRNVSPVGGFYYNDPLLGRTISTDGNLDKLVKVVVNFRNVAGKDIPDNLAAIIEDEICMRQPPGKCYYTKGLGDLISQVIHATARAIDSVSGTSLEKKARGCGGCGKRRNKLNR